MDKNIPAIITLPYLANIKPNPVPAPKPAANISDTSKDLQRSSITSMGGIKKP
jgi:hypothetical protein